jgi:TfoX/Sxy family transcriptional regulator of competence genes
MTQAQQSLVERIRSALGTEHNPREVAMFGGRAFMINEKMVVSAGKNGDLLVRVDAEDHDHLLREPGARQAVMGKDRTMGPGWITVAAESLDTTSTVEFWITVAMRFNRIIVNGHSRSREGHN